MTNNEVGGERTASLLFFTVFGCDLSKFCSCVKVGFGTQNAFGGWEVQFTLSRYLLDDLGLVKNRKDVEINLMVPKINTVWRSSIRERFRQSRAVALLA